ncbi:MAG: thioredoxin family protein [Candidatus Cloacimonetes bacterium]|nr:thioredoxin family protein [Candidatus Cloacimonadota bacterium]
MKSTPKSVMIIVLLLAAAGLFANAEVTFSITPETLKPGEKGTIKAVLTIPAKMHQTYVPGEYDFFYLTASGSNLTFGKTVYPKPHKIEENKEWTYEDKVALTLPFTIKSDAKAGNISVKAEMGYNICLDTGACMPPETVEKTFTLKITDAETITDTQESVDSIAVTTAESDIEPEPAIPVKEEKTTGDDIWKYLLMAFLGGLILNATPCVLPILPIRIMKIINQAQSDEKKVLNHTFLYALGVMLSFAILAGIFVALKMAGESVGWGMQNQNPGFVIVLMSIVFAFALSLLGVFEIQLPAMGKVSQVSGKSGYGGSFFGGIFAFLMAISCTGPFLGLALPFALKLSPLMMMVFFLIIGLGFASPFIVIGFFRSAMKLVPKPGEWMVIFKQLMGFVLLWIVYTQLKTLLALTDGEYFMKVFWYLMILGFAIWLYGRFVRYEHSRATQWVFTIIPVLLIVGAAWYYLPHKEEAPQNQEQQVLVEGLIPAPKTPEGWYVFSEKVLNDELQKGRAVFLDIGAEWCKNCKTNEKTVLFTESMMQEFKDRDVLLLKADFTKKDAVIFDWIQKHDRIGVPFNALYIPGKEPIIFSEILTKGEVIKALNLILE